MLLRIAICQLLPSSLAFSSSNDTCNQPNNKNKPCLHVRVRAQSLCYPAHRSVLAGGFPESIRIPLARYTAMPLHIQIPIFVVMFVDSRANTRDYLQTPSSHLYASRCHNKNVGSNRPVHSTVVDNNNVLALRPQLDLASMDFRDKKTCNRNSNLGPFARVLAN